MVLIVGAGLAGLSAGIHLLLSGVEVTVVESANTVGGNLTGWDRGGYHIDNCVHWLTGTSEKSKFYEIWRTLGALDGANIYQPESLYTVTHGEKSISLYSDIEKLRERMLEISPEDKEETEKLILDVKKIAAFEGLREGEKRGIPIKTLYKYYKMTAGELSERFSHPLLKRFLSSFLTEYFGSLAILFVFAHFTHGNAALPVGGSREMANRIKERFLSLHGKLILGNGVTKIKTCGGVAKSALLSDGEEIFFDYIIYTPDPKLLFSKMIEKEMPHSLLRRYNNPRLSRFSSFHTAFAVMGEEMPFWGDLVVSVSEKNKRLLERDYFVIREFSHERSFAPKGNNIIEAMTFLSEREAFEFIFLYKKNRERYNELKKRLSSVIEEEIERACPTLAKRLSYLDSWSPATYNRYTGSECGSYMSFAFTSRFIPTSLPIRIGGVSNLYLASQWTAVPGGLPMAAERGRLAARKIIAEIESEKKSSAAKRKRKPKGAAV